MNEGTTHRADGKRWKLAIEAALAKRGTDKWEALTALATKLLDAADKGEGWAIKELGDRFDGKPSQQIQLADNEGGKLEIRVISYADSP